LQCRVRFAHTTLQTPRKEMAYAITLLLPVHTSDKRADTYTEDFYKTRTIFVKKDVILQNRRKETIQMHCL
jgi:hypothetical protein